MREPIFPIRMGTDDRYMLQTLAKVYQKPQSAVVRDLVAATYGLLIEQQGKGEEKEARPA